MRCENCIDSVEIDNIDNNNNNNNNNKIVYSFKIYMFLLECSFRRLMFERKGIRV